MNLQHINIKFFVDGASPIAWEKFIEIFHAWTAEQRLPEMMIDVADYRHVPKGPGVVLVGHEADYAMDNTGGRPGLRYNCKVAMEGTNETRLKAAIACAADACAMLEQEVPGLRFRRDGFELTINDRAVASNTEASRSQADQTWPELLSLVCGCDAGVQFEEDPRKLLGCQVKLGQPLEFPLPASS